MLEKLACQKKDDDIYDDTEIMYQIGRNFNFDLMPRLFHYKLLHVLEHTCK